MAFWFALMLTALVEEQRLVRWLCKTGRAGLAWELKHYIGRKELRSDPTATYTFEFAKRYLQQAELANKAGAHEWAWVGAFDAMTVLEWKGEQSDPLFGAAASELKKAERHIASERIEEIRSAQEKVKAEHNNLQEYHFRKYTCSNNLSLWGEACGRNKRPRISQRPY